MILTFYCQFYIIKGFFISGLRKIHVVYTIFVYGNSCWKYFAKIHVHRGFMRLSRGVNIMEENDPWSYTVVYRKYMFWKHWTLLSKQETDLIRECRNTKSPHLSSFIHENTKTHLNLQQIYTIYCRKLTISRNLFFLQLRHKHVSY